MTMYNEHYVKDDWCRFCESKSRTVESTSVMVPMSNQGVDKIKYYEFNIRYLIIKVSCICMNGHNLIKENNIECILPKSIGTNVVGVNKYRKSNSWGYICNREGIKI